MLTKLQFQKMAAFLRLIACVTTAAGVQTWDLSVPLWRLLNYPAWAVSCEIAFYMAFPFLVPLVKRTARFVSSLCDGFEDENIGWPVFGLLFLFCIIGQLSSWYLLQFSLQSLGSSSSLAGDVAYT